MLVSREEIGQSFIVKDLSGPYYLKYQHKQTHLGYNTEVEWITDPFQATRFKSILEIDHKFRLALSGCEYLGVTTTSQVEIST